MKFLVDPADAGVPDVGCQPGLPPCAANEAVRRVAVTESGESLVTVADTVPVIPVYRDPGFGFEYVPTDVMLRSSVVKRLARASRALPAGFDLVVLDGWRSPRFQQELLSYYASRSDAPLAGYVSDPADEWLVAPHTTGGAVDLTLRYAGAPLALGTQFDDFSAGSHLAALEHQEAHPLHAGLRRLLARVLTEQEFAPYPQEWWHWSYGDQRWAAQYQKDHARYGALTR